MLERLFEDPAAPWPGVTLPAGIRHRHDGDFALLPETRLYSNFVTTLDGVADLGEPGVSSGAVISERNQDDRFLMALLRAFATHVLVGAGTFNSEPRHAWTAQAIFPSLADEFTQLRRAMGLEATPTLLVASRRDSLDRGHAAFGAQEVRVVDDLGGLPEGRILTEGGPRLMASLIGRLDEIFLTLAPALAGRGASGSSARAGMVEGTEFAPVALPRYRLLALRRSDSLLFARYARAPAPI